MIEYVYIVKCPNCEDEHFHFLNDAKDYAMRSLTRKPVITQVEVNRNDFGECTDSCDLGTVWSWEEMMRDVPAEPEAATFSKSDTLACDNWFDQEFDDLDNSLDFVPDTFRKPVPVDMSIDDLVEAIEENEDDVECKSCHELFDKSECVRDDYRGYLCSACQRAVVSDPNISEATLDEAIKPNETVDFDYEDLWVQLQINHRPNPEYGADWDEIEDRVQYTYTKNKSDVATDIWENFITDEDATDVPGGLEALEDDAAWEKFLETHFDILLNKYYNKLLDYYREEAAEAYEEDFYKNYDPNDNHYDEYMGESCASKKSKSFLEELEEPGDYRSRLADCPECGGVKSLDHETGICINCGFML